MVDRRLGLLAVVVGLVGCFQSSYDFTDGTIRCEGTACPPGYSCVAELCWRRAPQPQEPSADAPLGDAPLAMPDGPLVMADAPPPRIDARPRIDSPPGTPDACVGEDMGTLCAGRCGVVSDRCGTSVDCGSTCATAGYVCGGTAPNVCGCKQGTKQCSGQTPESCSPGGTWVDGSPCPNACTAGECTTCSMGSAGCSSDNWTQTCNASGSWDKVTSCSAQAKTCENGACVGVCTVGSIRCLPPNTAETCDAHGQWSSSQACSGRTCLDGLGCSGVCGPGDVRCSQNLAQSCDPLGQWRTDVTCSVSCSDGVCCTGSPCTTSPGAPCNTTATKDATCDKTYACSGACAAGFTCGGNGAAPSTCACSPGAFRCVGNTSQQCNSTGTAWVDQPACANICVASLGTCGDCNPGDTKCTNNAYFQCMGNGFWDGGAACVNTTCIADSSCGGVKGCLGSCAPSQLLCNADTVHYDVCDACGNWVDHGDACSDPMNTLCVPGQNRCGCNDSMYSSCEFGPPDQLFHCNLSTHTYVTTTCGDVCCDCTAVHCTTMSKCNLECGM